MLSATKAVLHLLLVAVVCGQPPWLKYTSKYSGGEAVQGGSGSDYQQLMKKYTHAGGSNSNTTGFGNYENFVHQYAGSYEKYMSSADQSRSSSKAGGNIPKYSKQWLDQTPAKGFEKYMDVNKSDRQFMWKHGGVNYTQYMLGGAGGAVRGSDDYEKYVNQNGGWAKGNSSGDYSQYYKKYMSRGKGGASGNSPAVRAYYKKQYMEKYAPKGAQSEESMKNSSVVRAYYKKKYMEEYAPKFRQEAVHTSHVDTPGQSASDSKEEEIKPAAKEVTKPATQDETKPASKQVTKAADARSHSKATQTVQPATQDETKPAAKKVTKPADARSQSKATQMVQPATQDETKPAAKQVTKPANARSQSKATQMVQPAAHDETKPAAKQVTEKADAGSQTKATQTAQPAAQDETKPDAKQVTKPANARSQSKATQTVVQKAPLSEKALSNLRQQAKQSVKEQLLTMSGSTSPVTAFFAVASMAGFCLTVFSVVKRQQSHLVFDDTADHYFLQA